MNTAPLMAQFGMQASLSQRRNCYDNAPIERFFGTLKNELIHRGHYTTREQARNEITEYIDSFYNRYWRRARLGYLSPAGFTQQYRQRHTA
jgi:putative transposase